MNRAAAFLLGFAITSPALAAPQPIDLQPAGPWKVEYAESECLLSRPYVANGQTYQLELTFEPVETNVWLRLHGPRISRYRYSGDAVVDVDGVEVGKKIHFNVIPKPTGTTTEIWLREFSKVRIMQRSIRLAPKKFSELRVSTEGFQKAMEAAGSCVDDLHRSLGVDPALLRTIAVKPDGLAGRFMDLPDFQDEFHFRILFWVNTNGRVDECHLLAPTGNAGFDKNACEQLKRNARFKPARDASGSAIRAPVYENAHIRRQITRSN